MFGSTCEARRAGIYAPSAAMAKRAMVTNATRGQLNPWALTIAAVAPSGSNRQPHGNLARTGGGTAQHQVHDISASDQQHHPRQRRHENDKGERQRDLLDLSLPVRRDCQRTSAVRLRVGLGELLANYTCLGRGLSNTDTWLQPPLDHQHSQPAIFKFTLSGLACQRGFHRQRDVQVGAEPDIWPPEGFRGHSDHR